MLGSDFAAAAASVTIAVTNTIASARVRGLLGAGVAGVVDCSVTATAIMCWRDGQARPLSLGRIPQPELGIEDHGMSDPREVEREQRFRVVDVTGAGRSRLVSGRSLIVSGPFGSLGFDRAENL